MVFFLGIKVFSLRNIVMMHCLALVAAVLFLGQPAAASEYVIGAGDRVQVFVWGEPELSVSALVRPDGRISLPGAGELMAEGQTSVALQDEITKRLTALVKDPRVTVSMADIVNNKVYIIGGGVPTGVFELKQKTSLLQLLAGMDLTRADLNGAHVMRDGARLDRDFDNLLHKGDVGQDLDLRHNDIIFFPALPEPYVYVLGAVNSPRSLPFKDGMTVLDAVVECGGFTKFADRNKTVLVRRENGAEKRITVRAADLVEGKDLSQNVVLQRGDYLIANESFF
jgi:polysaccharide export outer membrane protein